MAASSRFNALLLVPAAALLLAGVGWGARALLIHRAETAIAATRAAIPPIETAWGPPPPPRYVPAPWGPDNAWDLLRPAFDAISAAQAARGPSQGIVFADKPDFDAHEPLRRVSEPHVDACRRAVARSDHEWKGPVDPDLGTKAALAMWLLCAKAARATREGRDEEAVDFLLATLAISQATERTGGRGARYGLRLADLWVFDATRSLLSGHALSAARLDDLAGRLDRLRASRRPPILEIPVWTQEACRSVLDPDMDFPARIETGSAGGVDLREARGWKDLWSPEIRLARILAEIQDSAREAESLPWTSAADLEGPWRHLCLGFRRDEPGPLWTRAAGFGMEFTGLLRLDVVRVAVGLARFEAAHGRMPVTLDEAGVGRLLRRPATLEGNRLTVDLHPPGTPESFAASELRPPDLVWSIRRR